MNFIQSTAVDLCCCAKTCGKDVDDLRADIGIELACHPFGSDDVRIGDRCRQRFRDVKGLPKAPRKLVFRGGGRMNALLRNPQLVHQHSAIGFLEASVMACRGECAMKIEIGENDRFHILLRKSVPEFVEAILDRGQIMRRPADGGEVAYQRLKDIHGFVVVDNVDKLQDCDFRSSVGFELDQIFRSKTDQGLPDGSTRNSVGFAEL